MVAPYELLSSLMMDKAHREIECRKVLSDAKEKLVRSAPNRFLRFEPEYRGHTGDSDLVVTCEVENDAGVKCIEAYVWEVKSPQCHVFEFDNKNRVKPTKELISAENQLLHYYEEYKNSAQFKAEFGIVSSDNIHIGGIIIGQKANLVKPSNNYADEAVVKSLYTRAINCRKEHFYKASRINFIIWDRILEFLRPVQDRTPDRPSAVKVSLESAPLSIAINKNG